jgi:hypothetical protein
MSVSSYVSHLRSKPEHVRRRVAFWSSFGVTALIALFWVVSFTTIGSSAQGAIADTVNRVQTPAQSMIAGVGSVFTDIKEIFIKPRKVEYKPIEVLPGN